MLEVPLRLRLRTGAVAAFVLGSTVSLCLAQVATDGTMGARVSLAGPNYNIAFGLGTAVNRNLFHSFETFNLGSGQTATFQGVVNLQNIIARITDPRASVILGTVRSTTTGASLYLVNPNGIVFGPGALVDVNGSFYASSAHYIQFADGSRFESRIGAPVSLSFAMPSGFGFDAGPIAPMLVQGATLRAREGADLGIIGGGILVGGVPGATRLQAPGGHAMLVAVASPGVVEHGAGSVALNGFGALADLLVQRGASIEVGEGASRSGGGLATLRGHHVALDQAHVDASTRFTNARGIDILAAGDLTIASSEVTSVTTGAGAAGGMRLGGTNVVISRGSLLDTSCDPGCTTGNGGRIAINARDVLHIDGTQGDVPTYVISNSFGDGRTGEIEVNAATLVMEGVAYMQSGGVRGGDASGIRLNTGNIVLRGGAQVDSSTRGTGRGGRIVVENSGAIRVEGGRRDPATGAFLPSGFFSNTEGSGAAGGIVISTRTLEVLAGGEVSSSARRGSSGAGGNIAVTASEAIRILGAADNGKASGIVTNALGSGNAGEITLAAEAIAIADDAKVQSQSEGPGRAGRIRISGGDLTLASRGQVSSDARDRGDAGQIDIALTGTLTISGGNTGIFAKTYGPAQGGSISVDARQVAIGDSGVILASSDGSGNAGRVAVHAAGGIVLSDGAKIGSETSSAGSAGRVSVRSDGAIDITSDARISTSTTAAGNAGSVEVEARNLAMSGGGTVASESSGSGLAGNLDVRIGEALNMSGGAQITTSATTSDGGNIRVEAGTMAFIDDARIATAVGRGQGSGGNIELALPTFILRGGTVSANAFGGAGGNIHIATSTFFKSATSAVTASSQLGVDGTIRLDSPALDPSGELAAPAPTFLDVGAILAGRCGPRLAGRASSLVIAARAPEGGLAGAILSPFQLPRGPSASAKPETCAPG